jgi:hypothetical protein
MAEKLKEAARIETELLNKARTARSVIVELKGNVNEVRKKYVEASAKIEEARRAEEEKRAVLQRQLETTHVPSSHEEAFVVQKQQEIKESITIENSAKSVISGELNTAPVPSAEVTAKDGGVETLKTYTQIIPSLISEQEQAGKTANEFTQEAEQVTSQHQTLIKVYQDRAKHYELLAKSATTEGASVVAEKDKRPEELEIPDNPPLPTFRPERGKDTTIGDAGKGGENIRNTNPDADTLRNNNGDYNGSGTLVSEGPVRSTGGGSGSWGNALAGLGGAAAAVGGGAGGDAGAVDSSSASIQRKSNQIPKTNNLYADTAKNGTTGKNEKLSDQLRRKIAEEEAVAAGSTNGDFSSASIATGSTGVAGRHGAGKANATGASVAGNIALGGDGEPKESPDEIARSLGKKLDGQVISLAGSDTDAAVFDMVTEMEETLGLSEGLTAEEESRLGPIAKKTSGDNARSNRNTNRQLASAQGSGEKIDLLNLSLFPRVKEMIHRKIKMGNVHNGLPDKL